ncbi:MAG: GLPGLI family protein [Bacteroidetes bacterium]|nr:GLPGLI family protein [Bacteroidota bacterium]
MKKIVFIASLFYCSTLYAQQYINNGLIEYQVRVDNYKSMGDDSWGRSFRDRMPNFSVSYFDLIFNNNKAIYKFNRQDKTNNQGFFSMDRSAPDDNIWFNDYTSGTFTDQKNVFGDFYVLHDSLLNIKWKMVPNETREIAGFNCRKAQAIIFDSVYVFAFYTDEITVSGGPMGLHGLPGMILGITIPRMFTSWIASKVQINGVNFSAITEPTEGKKKKASELLETVKKATSDWGSYAQQMLWKLYL